MTSTKVSESEATMAAMWNTDGFRMADGVEMVGRDGDRIQMRVSIPTDEDGFFGRQCPSCSQTFRIGVDDYKSLPSKVELRCVYCGHHDEHSKFLTDQQRVRVMRAARDLSVQMVKQSLSRAFRGLSTPSRLSGGFGVRVTYRSKPFYPEPLPDIDEERLVRVRQCADCYLRYAVFGEHRFCPVCGPLPAGIVALDALTAETARLDGLAQLPASVAATLREQGVFTRIWVDTLENLVGLVETLGSSLFNSAVSDAAERIKAKGNIFQRLDGTAELFIAAGYPDLRSLIDPAVWQRLQQVWATRQVFTHNDGVVDTKYLAKVPTSPARVGQRLTISDPLCRQAIADTEVLCRVLSALTTTSTQP